MEKQTVAGSRERFARCCKLPPERWWMLPLAQKNLETEKSEKCLPTAKRPDCDRKTGSRKNRIAEKRGCEKVIAKETSKGKSAQKTSRLILFVLPFHPCVTHFPDFKVVDCGSKDHSHKAGMAELTDIQDVFQTFLVRRRRHSGPHYVKYPANRSNMFAYLQKTGKIRPLRSPAE